MQWRQVDYAAVSDHAPNEQECCGSVIPPDADLTCQFLFQRFNLRLEIEAVPDGGKSTQLPSQLLEPGR